jgi:hypothetical protein
MPGVTPQAELPPLKAYRIERPLAYVLEGSGQVADRGHNRLVLSGLSGESVILAYHHLPGLESDPPAHIEPVYLPGDPNPFIRILAPPPRLELRLR